MNKEKVTRRTSMPRCLFSACTFLRTFRGHFFLLAIFLITPLTGAAAGEETPPKKITFDDHIQPIFRQYCLSCHSADARKGDLAIDAYAAMLEGGASGEVVTPGDLEDSRLWDLVSHEDEPKMPPEADKLPEDKLDLIRRWIEGGALENSGSVAQVKKPSGLAMLGAVAIGKPEGPAAMPKSTFREPVVYSARSAAVTSLAASPWAPVLAVAGQRQVSFYHSETARLLGVIPFLEGVPQVVQFSRDGRRLLVAGGRGAAVGLAALYDVQTGSRLLSAGDEYDTVHAADLNAKQTLIALGGPLKIVKVYEATDNALAYEIRKHTDWITAISFSPDGEMLVTADRNGGVFLWEAETGREVASLRGHAGEVTSVSWRADSQVLATSGVDGTVRLWGREQGNQIKSWAAHGGGTTSVRFAADGRLVSAGRDRMVKLWNGEGGHVKDLATFGDIALVACISYDGHRVAAGDFLGEVRLIDIESGQQVGLLPPNPPTLAMRVTSAAAQLAAESKALAAATVVKQEVEKAMASVQAEAGRRAAKLEEEKKKLAAAQSALEVAVKDLAAKRQAMTAEGVKVKQATVVLTQASAAVTAAEAELSKAREASADTAAAVASLTAATQQTKQAITGIEAGQASLKAATDTTKAAEAVSTNVIAGVATAQQGVEAAQSAINEYAPQLKATEADLATKSQEVTTQQAAAAAAQQMLEGANAEQAAFAAAVEHFATAISTAEQKAAAEAKLLATAVAAREQAVSDLAVRKAAAEEFAKQLATIQAEYDALKKTLNESQTIESQKAEAVHAAELAQLQAAAAAAQAKADKELFEKSQTVRTEYAKK